jgi:hypothetical protein
MDGRIKCGHNYRIPQAPDFLTRFFAGMMLVSEAPLDLGLVDGPFRRHLVDSLWKDIRELGRHFLGRNAELRGQFPDCI